jgi:ABC-type lipoprotein release transport system permease subunit
MAVGAQPGEVTRMIVMTSLRYSIIGIVGGTASALVAARLLKSFLSGLRGIRSPLPPRSSC